MFLNRDFHERVARALANKLNLSEDYERVFVKAIREPDRRRRRNPRERHHRLRTGAIINRVVNARIYYLRDDIASCLKELGIALHFIQDAYVPPPRNRMLRTIHASIERKARSVTLNSIVREVDVAFRESRSSYEFVVGLISQIRPVFDAELAIREAIRTSALVAAAVFGPKEPPVDLIPKFEVAMKRHKKQKAKAMKTVLAILSASLAMGITLGLTGNQAIVLPLVVLSLILAVSTYTYMSTNAVYHILEGEALWYGLTWRSTR